MSGAQQLQARARSPKHFRPSHPYSPTHCRPVHSPAHLRPVCPYNLTHLRPARPQSPTHLRRVRPAVLAVSPTEVPNPQCLVRACGFLNLSSCEIKQAQLVLLW